MFKNKRKQRQAILERQQNVKDENFDFESIALYCSHENHQDAHQIIDDRTLHDLDFEELFIALDRTASCIGQQYLYARLRVLSAKPNSSQELERYITTLDDRPEEKNAAIIELNALNDRGAYFIQRLFFGDQLQKPKWFWLIPTLSVAVVLALLASLFYSQAILFALLLVGINTIIHLWNKNNIMGYANTIPQLLRLHSVAASVNAHELFLESKEKIDQSIQILYKIRWAAIFFKWESKALSEIAQAFEYVFDLVKGALLLEPMILFSLLRQIESHKSDIKTLYEAVGQLDFAISILTWRDSLPYYCIPEFDHSPSKTWDSEKLYHPLIDEAVANDLELTDQKSILLTGSNMSGKSTFIRTIGINALLAQTLNTACAQNLTLSNFKIYSAIRISDDLFEHTSYYYQEVKTIKKFADASQLEQHNLFLLDEIFKGTNTIERIASGKAVLTYLHDTTNLVFCSTHDLELIDYLQENYAYYHFEEQVVAGQLTFDYQLKKGSLSHTNAIRILEINNFPDQITEEANELAADLLKMKRRKE